MGFSVHLGPGHQEKKLIQGNFFDFCTPKCIKNCIPRDQKPHLRGF